jgi:DNA-binding NtrC family response regulator
MTRLGKVRVLVVDDDKNRADIVRRRLCEDFEIVNASPGPSAVRLLETQDFDLLISDQRDSTKISLAGGLQQAELVGSCPAMMALLAKIEQAANQTGDIHLVGETGSGKALVARSIHGADTRTGAFVRIRLKDLNASEMEAAVFGSGRPSAGTFFLDGIEFLPADLQERLAREHSPGQSRERGYRLITASCLPLGHASMSESWRQLVEEASSNFTSITVPALRDRGEDIPRLAVHFLVEAMKRSGRLGVTLGRQAMAELCAHNWPGNVSELKQVVDDIVLRTNDNREIGPGAMLSGGQSFIVEQVVSDIIGGCRGLDAAMAELEAAVIREALHQQRGNRSAAARQLKLPRQTLQDRMKKHGLWS